ncbi:hypothetical protein CAOG_06648 [Capsaspora owczarzaki ATCC 30864]|uniref:Programmed cell death protein 5 n=1 Tax=Capsaspora owczarzaki (strain ATCC 30864) TaxID=595528 RepID=A0A0D2UMN9_CAPO3|nr:hypothetical protein CAOG_06648 [Capsaspora owczarzaki ATCC 30864]KJE96306.1 hypothetical protein CAOG_006648 [Capsaspora owczarzaki ATCC 30864]|eukprot:XP_004344269.2 hypothetical protein CAOG_06648 [Capsaspora owczarzaki ATCC 30864]
MADGDDELAAIRARRMAELQQKSGQGQSLPGGVPGMGGAGGNNAAKQEEAARRETEVRQSLLMQILEQEARARLGRIASVKPEKARAVEDLLIRMAKSGQLPGMVDEPQLIKLLSQVSEVENSKKASKLTYTRKTLDDDDDDE